MKYIAVLLIGLFLIAGCGPKEVPSSSYQRPTTTTIQVTTTTEGPTTTTTIIAGCDAPYHCSSKCESRYIIGKRDCADDEVCCLIIDE